MRHSDIPVFAAPGRGRGTGHVEQEPRPVDLVHLARQTGGDRALEEEVLRLFLRQAGAIGRAMRERAPCEQRKRAAHTLKGAARSIGALAVAESAGRVEDNPNADGQVNELLTDIDRTCDFINSLLR